MSRICEELFEAIDLFWMLWWHGTFPLRWVVYSAGVAFLSGIAVGVVTR